MNPVLILRALERVVGKIESFRMNETDRDELVRAISAHSAVKHDHRLLGWMGVKQLCPRSLRKTLKKTTKEVVKDTQEWYQNHVKNNGKAGNDAPTNDNNRES